MTLRVSINILATVWNIVMLVTALHKRELPMFKSLVALCLVSALFSLSWAIGIVTAEAWIFRFNWIGCFMAPGFLSFLWEQNPSLFSKKHLHFSWTLAAVLFAVAQLPLTVLQITSTVPFVDAVYGPLEIPVRAMLSILIIHTVGMACSLAWKISWSNPIIIFIFGVILYSTGALISASILPLLRNHQFLEFTTVGTVTWTTLGVLYSHFELNQKQKVLEDLNRFKSDFIDQVTHDFKSPLNAIESAVDVLDSEKNTNSQKKQSYLTMIRQNTSRLTGFVDDLLAVAELKIGSFKLSRTSFSIREFASRVTNEIKPIATTKGISINLEGENTFIEGDQAKLAQVLLNLISNAIKASEPNQTIKLRWSKTNNHVHFSVEDEGMGISRGEQEKIFDKFYHLNKNGFSNKGTGLGLTIAKAWVEAHGGKIWAESEGEGNGTTVTFTLPGGV